MIFFKRVLGGIGLVALLCVWSMASEPSQLKGVPTIELNSPTVDAKVNRSLVLFKGKAKGIKLLLLNGAPIPIKEDGSFYYRAQLFAKNSYNFFILKGESSEGEVVYLNRKVFYQSF